MHTITSSYQTFKREPGRSKGLNRLNMAELYQTMLVTGREDLVVDVSCKNSCFERKEEGARNGGRLDIAHEVFAGKHFSRSLECGEIPQQN